MSERLAQPNIVDEWGGCWLRCLGAVALVRKLGPTQCCSCWAASPRRWHNANTKLRFWAASPRRWHQSNKKRWRILLGSRRSAKSTLATRVGPPIGRLISGVEGAFSAAKRRCPRPSAGSLLVWALLRFAFLKSLSLVRARRTFGKNTSFTSLHQTVKTLLALPKQCFRRRARGIGRHEMLLALQKQ